MTLVIPYPCWDKSDKLSSPQNTVFLFMLSAFQTATLLPGFLQPPPRARMGCRSSVLGQLISITWNSRVWTQRTRFKSKLYSLPAPWLRASHLMSVSIFSARKKKWSYFSLPSLGLLRTNEMILVLKRVELGTILSSSGPEQYPEVPSTRSSICGPQKGTCWGFQ